MMQKEFFFQKSNKWDAAKDALHLEVQQQALHHCEREKRKYEKQNNHWDSGIVESRKKRMHSRDGASAGEPESEASVVNSAEVPTIQIMKKMTVKQFMQEIKSPNLQVNGKSKLKIGELIEVLKNND